MPRDEEILYQKRMIIAALIYAGERGLKPATVKDLLGIGDDRYNRLMMSMTDIVPIYEDTGSVGIVPEFIQKWDGGECMISI